MILSNFLSVIDNSPVAMKTISTERSILGSILGWVRMIGIGLALIMLTIIALIYLTAESPEKAGSKPPGRGTSLFRVCSRTGRSRHRSRVSSFRTSDRYCRARWR